MKIIKYIFFALVVLFIGIQFFQPAKNIEPVESTHIFNQEDIPETMVNMLQTNCLDCHSNQTRYKLYHNVAPLSWAVNKHIVDGKKELNLSEWGNLSAFDKIAVLNEMSDEVQHGSMPLKSYQMMHKEAVFSQAKKDTFSHWAESLAEDILKREVDK